EQALAVLKRLVQRAPQVPDNHFRFGLALAAENRDLARQAFEVTVKLAPTHWAAQQMLVEYDLADGRGDAARSRVEQLVEDHPGEIAPLLIRANIRMAQNDLSGAEGDLLKALERQPAIPQAYVHLARIYYQRKENEQAVKTLAASAEKNQSASVYTQLGMLYSA